MKRIIFFTLIGIAIFSMVRSVESVVSLWQKREIILETQRGVKKEQEENKKLKQELQAISQPIYVEQEARNKLFMVKPGEKVVFIPGDTVASYSAQGPLLPEKLSNWEAWWHLFF